MKFDSWNAFRKFKTIVCNQLITCNWKGYFGGDDDAVDDDDDQGDGDGDGGHGQQLSWGSKL